MNRAFLHSRASVVVGLTYDFDDLPRLMGLPDVMGGTWFRSREVKIDQSLDPTVFPTRLGRYRFTVAHEVGHWELHRHRYLSGEGQVAMFAGEDRPVVCRSNDTSPLEWQADCFAGYLLLPKEMVYTQWKTMHGSRAPYVAIDEIAEMKARWGLGDDERPTVEVTRQMAPVFLIWRSRTRICWRRARFSSSKSRRGRRRLRRNVRMMTSMSEMSALDEIC